MSLVEERFDLEVLRGAVRYQRWLLSVFGSALSGRLLEVGPGIGNFTRWLAGSADTVVAVDPDQAMCRDVLALGQPNVRVLDTALENLAGADDSFDCVFLCNVLEHIHDDAEALRAAYSLVAPGGHVCIVVPAHPRLFGSLDRRYGHLRRYRRGDVRMALEATGFVDVSACYFNPVGAVGWFAVSRAAKRPHLTRTSVWLSEWLAVPLGRALRRVGPPPFGQSVVAMGRKPAVTETS
ncbi:MAG: class I SAM-dependent methyltransferase [Actinomycetota bacterium]|nr:class I SAM-dependent methyltransferase [Actinomycetota bacterium]